MVSFIEKAQQILQNKINNLLNLRNLQSRGFFYRIIYLIRFFTLTISLSILYAISVLFFSSQKSFTVLYPLNVEKGYGGSYTQFSHFRHFLRVAATSSVFSIVAVICISFIFNTTQSLATGGLVMIDSTVSQFTSTTDSDLAGHSVASAGDVNNDGYDDFMIATYESAGELTSSGAVYLYYGKEDNYIPTTLNDTTAAKFVGEEVNGILGTELASGDINGDGFSDMVIGAQNYDGSGSDTGAVYLVYGQNPGFMDTTISASNSVKFTGEVTGDAAGSAVSTGDVNNDGYADILIGAYGNDAGGVGAGAVYLIYGQAEPMSDITLSASNSVKFLGEAGSDLAGYTGTIAGDLNNDGYNDILIGAYSNDEFLGNAGATYLIYGQAAALSDITLSSATSVKFTGEASGDNSSRALAYAGDVNNDGYDDFLIGATLQDEGSGNGGAVYLLYGQSTAMTDTTINATNTSKFFGTVASNNVPDSLAPAGDVNNDGYDDFLIGSKNNDITASNAGAAFVILGKSMVYDDTNLDTTSTIVLQGETANDNAGVAVANAGDINNDGVTEILIGAFTNDEGGSNAGAAYVVYPKTKPVVIGSTSVIHECTDLYSDGGATANDVFAGAPLTVNVTGSVNVNTLGPQTITYTTNPNFFAAVGTATRTVTVQDTTAPTITLNGSSAVTVDRNASYTDAGATASDACDTGVAVVRTGTVDTSTPGDYVLTYSASDVSDNAATVKTRTVTVLTTSSDASDSSNQAPTLTQEIPNISFASGTTQEDIFNLNDYFTDSNTDELTFSVTGTESVVVTIADDGGVSIGAPEDFVGTENLYFVATDPSNATATSNAVAVVITEAQPNPEIAYVKGKTKGKGIITVVGVDKSILAQWQAFGKGGVIPILGTRGDTTLIFAVKYGSGSTMHVYTKDGDLLKKKRLSPRLHIRKLAVGQLDNVSSLEVVVASSRGNTIYLKIFSYHLNEKTFTLRKRKKYTAMHKNAYQVIIQKKQIKLLTKNGKEFFRYTPF